MPIQAYFENIQPHIAHELQQAKSQIDIAVAWFTDAELYRIVCQRAEQGEVAITLLLLNDAINNANYGLDFEQLTNLGGNIQWIDANEDSLMHNKFCIIDQQTVITGSYNWTVRAQRNDENISIVKDDANFAADFITAFAALRKKYGYEPLPNTIQATEALIAQKKQELLRLEQHLTHLKNAPTPNTRSSKLQEVNKEQKVKVIDLSGDEDTTPTLKPLPQPIQQLINDLVAVEGGTFMMGSDEYNNEKPIHQVRLDTFKIAKYQVTQAQWEAVMGTTTTLSNPSFWQAIMGTLTTLSNPSHFKGDNLPVEQVSWDDCQTFIQTLNQQTAPYYTFALPTEAQWEYAARGGHKSSFNKGGQGGFTYAGSNNIDEVAWYGDNSNSKTHLVGQKKPNELRIYDMSGNVWEWCQDWYDADYYKNSPANNPTGPTSGSLRVLRGGSWFGNAAICRVADRNGITPSRRNNNGGFRLAVR